MLTPQLGEARRFPFAHCEQQSTTAPLGQRRSQAFFMKLGEFLA
jgi:hypothetical protein